MWSHHILRLVVILAQDISNKLQNQGKGAEWWSWNSEFWSHNLAVVCQKTRAWPKMSCRWTAVNEAQAFSSSLSIHRNTLSVHLQKNKRQPVGTALGPPAVTQHVEELQARLSMDYCPPKRETLSLSCPSPFDPCSPVSLPFDKAILKH